MFFTISVSVKWSAPDDSGLAAASCKNIRRPKAFIPKRLVRIVTVNPSKRVFIRLIASREAGTAYGNRGDTTTISAVYWATKLYWITPVTLTGCPDSLVGENLA
jgi:hypothetical protein